MIYYMSYEFFNHQFRNLLGDVSFFGNFLNLIFFIFIYFCLVVLGSLICNASGGVMAELCSSIIWLPTTIITQRLQIGRHVDFLPIHLQTRKLSHVMNHIWKTEGLKGYFRGFGAYMAVFGPGSAIWWASYEFFKYLFKLNFTIIPSGLSHSISGVLANLTCILSISPLDVSRTRLQLLEIANKNEKSKLNYGYLELIKDVYRKEGIEGFFKGVKPRIFVKIPSTAISMWLYEYMKELAATEK